MCVLITVCLVFAGTTAAAQELVYSTGSGLSRPSGLVVIPNLAGGLAASTPIYIDPLGGTTINPHGFTLIAPMTTVAAQLEFEDRKYAALLSGVLSRSISVERGFATARSS